jgi:uncharacterized protein (UPF0212 family)
MEKSLRPAPSAGRDISMTDVRVRQIINEQVAAAVAELKKSRCPHCGETIGATKIAKSKSVVTDFFDQLYNAPPTTPQSPSGGLFEK